MTNSAVTSIGPERPEDADAIRAVTTAAFADAAHASGTEAAIVDALRKAGALTLSLVAREQERVVGHVAFSPITIDGTDRGWYGLGPVSVDPTRQRRGIGRALILHGLSRLRERAAAGCVVVGDPAYYRRFGFAPDPALRLDGVPPEYFLCLLFAAAPPAGTVGYHSAFDAS